MTLWRGNFLHYYSFVRELHRSLVDSLHKRPIIQSFGVSLLLAWTSCSTVEFLVICCTSTQFKRILQKTPLAFTLCLLMTGMGLTKPICSVLLFSEFFIIVKTHDSYWIWRLYLTGVAAAQLWWHLSNINANGTVVTSTPEHLRRWLNKHYSMMSARIRNALYQYK